MRNAFFPIMLLVGTVICFPAFAEESKPEKEPYPYPWHKGQLTLGAYAATLDSSLTLGGSKGLGISIDVEDLLGLKTTDRSFRLAAGYRLGEKRRHKLEVSWFYFHREGQNTLIEEIPIPPELGGEPGDAIGPGTINSLFNFDIYKLKYEYSFILDDRSDLNLGIGLYIMPVEFGVTFTEGGATLGSIEESITAPLPVVGLGFDFAITPKWFIRQQLEVFYLEYDNFKGGITSLTAALEYFPWKHVGFGLGADALQVNIQATEQTDWPGLGDFVGTLEFSYIGAQLYMKLVF